MSPTAPPPDLTVSYGPDPDQIADLRQPIGRGEAALVVVVHGGFWRRAYDRAHAGPQSVALAEAGWAVATVEYRRVGQAGGGWPGTFDDVAKAVDTVPALCARASRHGGHDDQSRKTVDPDRVVLIGHSAGGHLALWAAGRHRLASGSPWRLDTAPALRGVVSLAGVADLTLAGRLHLGEDAGKALLGGDEPSRPERWAAADPVQRLPIGVPVTLVHGTDDEAVPVSIARSYADRARAAGDPVTLHELPGCGHFELIDPSSAVWRTVLAAVAALLG